MRADDDDPAIPSLPPVPLEEEERGELLVLDDVPTIGPTIRPNEGKTWGFARPKPYHASVRVPGWTGRMRVAHLTDLHFGNVTPVALQQAAVGLVNASHPDLTVLTGDFVARGLGHLDRMSAILGGIRGRKLAVMGNHDWWSGLDRVRAALDAAEIEVLDNRWTVQGQGEDALAIVGIDDQTTSHDDSQQATRGLHGRPALALSHNPEAAPDLWGRGCGVVLSGHTHGGQFYVQKWTKSLYASLLKVRYLNGWYHEDLGQVYVNPGVGSSVLPFRYGRPAQRAVAVIDLEGGAAAPPIHGW